MLLGILLMVLAGMGWVGIGAVVSHCAAKKVNLALVQLGQTVLCLAVGIAVMLFQEPELCSGRTRLLAFGVLFLAGVGNFSAFELMNRAMRVGPNGVVWALAQSALIFPFLFGVIFYGVPLTLSRVVGVALIVGSIALFGMAKKSAEEEASRSTRWLWLALGAFAAGGITQISANLPSYLEGGMALGSVTRTVYLQAGALAGFGLIWLINREKLEVKGTLIPTLGLTAFYLAIFFGLLFRGLNLLAEAGAGSIGYPIMIGSCIIGFFLYSLTVLREKVTPFGMAGFLLCLGGVVTISI